MSAKEGPRLLASCAAAAGLALTALFLLPRLPHSLDLIVPRRPFFGAFARAVESGRALESSAVVLLWLAALAAAFSVGLWTRAAWPLLRKNPGRAAAAPAGVIVAGLLASFFVFTAIDVVQNAWFFPESLDWREPLLILSVLALASALLVVQVRASCAWAAGGGRRGAAVWPLAALLAAGAGARAWAIVSCDAGRVSLAEAARLSAEPPRGRVFVVFIEKDGRPDAEVHRMELGAAGASQLSEENLAALKRYAARPSVYRLAALRYLYAAYTIAMQPAELRRELWRGVEAGEPAARLLLTQNLAWAKPDPAAAAALEALSDENQVRVGPMAAAELASAYARQGLAGKAAEWRARSKIPEGLLAPAQGPVKNGSVAGRVTGVKVPVWAALYAHPDAAAPYTLAAGQLVDAGAAGPDGRFELKGIPPGDYFLALRLDYPAAAPEGVAVRGARGDVHISAEHPRADLGVIELSQK